MNKNEKKARVAILASDKTDFKKKNHYKRQKRSFVYNDQGINAARR